MPVLLLVLFSIALSIGLGIVVVVIRRARHKPAQPKKDPEDAGFCPYEPTCIFRRPGCWLAIKGRSQLAVQSALGLHNPKPCSWIEGLAGSEKLFIAPPVKGWILVVGTGLPDPSDDIDACFRFVLDISRKLGQVQFFCLSRILHHHAWVKAERGKVVRAYAWAGRTLWQQGTPTPAERELDLKCFGYTDQTERPVFGQPDVAAINVDKVPLLAARWSLDPARIELRVLEAGCGIAGEPSLRY